TRKPPRGRPDGWTPVRPVPAAFRPWCKADAGQIPYAGYCAARPGVSVRCIMGRDVLRRPTEGPLHCFHGIYTSAPRMEALFVTLRRVARAHCTVLLGGETGTGKELVARAIHAESARRKAPFQAINCATFSPTLLESELFGHVRGAFTGALRD